MPRLTVRFLDNEVIEGSAEAVTLDAPDFHLALAEGTGNNAGAWIPLPAVKKISLGSGPADDHAAEHVDRQRRTAAGARTPHSTPPPGSRRRSSHSH